MKPSITFIFSILFSLFLFNIASPAQTSMKAPAPVTQPAHDQSLEFIENKNQWDKSVKFMANVPGGHLFLQEKSFMYAFYDESGFTHNHSSAGTTIQASIKKNKAKAHAYSVTFLGAGSPGNSVSGKNAKSALRNYFIGNDSRRWASNVKAYQEVSYKALYPGIEMRLYQKSVNLKYDFILQPGTSPDIIRMQYKGPEKIFLVNGDLHVKTSVNEVIERKPYAYQDIDNRHVEVPCHFNLENNVVSFDFPDNYNPAFPLVIDPVLVYSTYSGSKSDNWGFTATYDNDGNMYSGGIVKGVGFPVTTGAFDIIWNGNAGVTDDSAWDIGILKYNTKASGAASLLYATYLGGSNTEIPSSLIVNGNNELLILGATSSSNFPNTTNRTFNAGTLTEPLRQSSANNGGVVFTNGSDLIITRLSPDGSQLLASTFLGGTGNDGILGHNGQANLLDKNYGDQFRGDILTDVNNNIYIVSNTQSANFPIVNGFQNNHGGGVLDAVVVKLTSSLAIQWSSFLGGSGVDAAYSIQLDAANNIFVCGGTNSPNLPNTAGSFKPNYQSPTPNNTDGFVAKISNNGSAIQRISYLGTQSYDQAYFVQLDDNADVYLLGQTQGDDYPVSVNVFSVTKGRQFIHKLNNNLTTSLFSTVFGSVNIDARVTIAPTAFLVDNCNRIYVSGWGGGANSSGQYQNGNTFGLPVTANADRSVTDGKDFYLMMLTRDAKALEFATFIGGDQNADQSGEHVDGGTSRFDKRGFVYQAVCGGCGGTNAFPTTANAWSKLNGTVGTLNPNCNNAAFKYDINIVTAEAGDNQTICANAAPIQLTGFSPATGGTWSGTGVSPTGLFTPSATMPSTVTLTYSVVNGSCISTSTKTITVNPAPVVSFTGLPPALCLPSAPITLIGTPAGGTFSGPGITGTAFNPTVAGAGTHTITYSFTNQFNCTVTTSQTTTLSILGEVNAGPDERICSGSFPLMLSGFSPAGGTWSGTGVSANGLFTPSEAIAGTHVLTYTVTNGACSIVKTKTVIVDPTIKFTQGPAISLCPDAPAYTITNQDITPIGGIWSGNGVTPNGIFSPSAALVGVNTLTYTVPIGLIGACSGVSTKDVTVFAPAVIQAAAVPTECGSANLIQGFAPFTANFTNTSTGATSYLWEFGDGTTSTEPVPSHLYTKDGQYEVTLTAFYGNGCSVKQRIAGVKVDKKQLVPNVFTPNKDGLNDTFVPRITCLETGLKIFNRWGKLVYEKAKYQNTWGGEGLSDGIYYYQLTSTKGQIWKGWVEIIR